MRSPSGPTLDVLARLRLTTAHVTALTDSVIVGGTHNRHNAMALLPDALVVLRERVDRAIEALAQERP